ncbi:MAG: hypothetical protein M5U34_19260 [Chloroflexi bacterium]|nr:hypothetical protein [Chloroflexota bacterium]
MAVIIAAAAELALHSFRGRVDLTWQIKESLARSGLDLTPEQTLQLEKISKAAIHEPAEVNQYTSFHRQYHGFAYLVTMGFLWPGVYPFRRRELHVQRRWKRRK